MAMLSYVVSGKNIFISVNGKSKLISSADKNYDKVLEMIKMNAPVEEYEKLFNNSEEIKKQCERAFKSVDGVEFNTDTICIDGTPVYGALCDYIKMLFKKELPLKPVANFVRKLRKNPSYRIREQLWGFISASLDDGGFTLDSEGNIIAYKVVSNDYKDKRTGKNDNRIGSVVTMDRKDVDDNPENTCSTGLHFCAYSYVKDFCGIGDHLMLVKVSPEDVVSIPTDYGFAKARCCKYEVIEEVEKPLNKPLYDNADEKDLHEQFCFECLHTMSYKEIVDFYKEYVNSEFYHNGKLVKYHLGYTFEEYFDAIMKDYEGEYDILTEILEEATGNSYDEWKSDFLTPDWDFQEEDPKPEIVQECNEFLEKTSMFSLMEFYKYMTGKETTARERSELVNQIINEAMDYDVLKSFIDGFGKEYNHDNVCIDWLNTATLSDLLAFAKETVEGFDENDPDIKDREDLVAIIRGAFDTYADMWFFLNEFLKG